MNIQNEDAINAEGNEFIAFAKCGDLEVGVVKYSDTRFDVIAAQIEDSEPVEVFRHTCETETGALQRFAQSILTEYA
jgi:hypothetical protein